MDQTLIPIECRTYLDSFETVEWPSHLCVRPIVGDWIEAIGHGTLNAKRLKIHMIVHCESKDATTASIPYLHLELHK